MHCSYNWFFFSLFLKLKQKLFFLKPSHAVLSTDKKTKRLLNNIYKFLRQSVQLKYLQLLATNNFLRQTYQQMAVLENWPKI